MSKSDADIYGTVSKSSDVKKIYSEIRDDVDKAKSRGELTKLYRRAGYMITLTYAPSWHKRFGDKAESLRAVAETEFRKTVRDINDRASKVGTKADYDEAWGKMKEERG